MVNVKGVRAFQAEAFSTICPQNEKKLLPNRRHEHIWNSNESSHMMIVSEKNWVKNLLKETIFINVIYTI